MQISGRALAVGADVFAKSLVNFGSLLHAVVEHGSPLFCVFVERNGAEQKAGLQNDFEGVAEVVRESADFFGLRFGDGTRRGCWNH
jgi:hypothetical protein